MNPIRRIAVPRGTLTHGLHSLDEGVSDFGRTSGAGMSNIDGSGVDATGDNEILTVQGVTGESLNQFVTSTVRSLGVKIDNNNVRPRTAPAISIEPLDDIWNLSLSSNSIYWNSSSASQSGNGYAIEINLDSIYATTIKDTRITGRGGTFDAAIRVTPTNVEGVIARDNIADELTASSSTCDLPVAKSGSVIIQDDLDVR